VPPSAAVGGLALERQALDLLLATEHGDSPSDRRVKRHQDQLRCNLDGKTTIRDLGPVPREGLERTLPTSFGMGQGEPNVDAEHSDEEQAFAPPVIRGPSANHRLPRLHMQSNDAVHVFAAFCSQLLKRSRTFAAMQETFQIFAKAHLAMDANIQSVWHPLIAHLMPAQSTDLRHFMRQLLLLPETRACWCGGRAVVPPR